jgi:hypothetical protein
MKREKTFISEEKFNQIKVEANLTEEDIRIINLKPRFPLLASLWLKIWLLFNKIR